MKKVVLALVLTSLAVHAQKPDPLEGLWQGYDGEWLHCSRQLLELAQAIPEEKYSWRPGPGVRSTSEVFMHIVITNYWLMARTGKPFPKDLIHGPTGGVCAGERHCCCPGLYGKQYRRISQTV